MFWLLFPTGKLAARTVPTRPGPKHPCPAKPVGTALGHLSLKRPVTVLPLARLPACPPATPPYSCPQILVAGWNAAQANQNAVTVPK